MWCRKLCFQRQGLVEIISLRFWILIQKGLQQFNMLLTFSGVAQEPGVYFNIMWVATTGSILLSQEGWMSIKGSIINFALKWAINVQHNRYIQNTFCREQANPSQSGITRRSIACLEPLYWASCNLFEFICTPEKNIAKAQGLRTYCVHCRTMHSWTDPIASQG